MSHYFDLDSEGCCVLLASSGSLSLAHVDGRRVKEYVDMFWNHESDEEKQSCACLHAYSSSPEKASERRLGQGTDTVLLMQDKAEKGPSLHSELRDGKF